MNVSNEACYIDVFPSIIVEFLREREKKKRHKNKYEIADDILRKYLLKL